MNLSPQNLYMETDISAVWTARSSSKRQKGEQVNFTNWVLFAFNKKKYEGNESEQNTIIRNKSTRVSVKK